MKRLIKPLSILLLLGIFLCSFTAKVSADFEDADDLEPRTGVVTKP